MRVLDKCILDNVDKDFNYFVMYAQAVMIPFNGLNHTSHVIFIADIIKDLHMTLLCSSLVYVHTSHTL